MSSAREFRVPTQSKRMVSCFIGCKARHERLCDRLSPDTCLSFIQQRAQVPISIGSVPGEILNQNGTLELHLIDD